MENFSNEWGKKPREMYYFRQRFKNRVFANLQSFFASECDRNGITKKDIALRLRKDPSQITRWLSSPSNLTIDTLSDLLFAMEAEANPPEIVSLRDRRQSNYMNPLMSKILNDGRVQTEQSSLAFVTKTTGTTQLIAIPERTVSVQTSQLAEARP